MGLGKVKRPLPIPESIFNVIPSIAAVLKLLKTLDMPLETTKNNDFLDFPAFATGSYRHLCLDSYEGARCKTSKSTAAGTFGGSFLAYFPVNSWH